MTYYKMNLIDLFRIGRLAILIFLASCSALSFFKSGEDQKFLHKSTQVFNFKDNTGEFLLYREKGFLKEKQQFVVKKKIVAKGESIETKNVLEQLISISVKSIRDKKIAILTPSVSEYSVWFDKKKYTSHMTIDETNKKLVLSLKSPEESWNGVREIPFPKDGNGVFCFLSQVAECAAITGFMKMAIEKGRGKMNFYLILEGFPYSGEQYVNLPDSPIAKAELDFDGQNSLGEKRFSLNFSGQSLFIFVNNNFELRKLFWPSQGLSMNLETEGL